MDAGINKYLWNKW